MSEQSESAGDTAASKKRRPYFRLIAVAVVGILALILVLQNTETVDTRILFITVTMPRAVLLLITFLLGGIAGLLADFLRKRPSKSKAA